MAVGGPVLCGFEDAEEYEGMVDESFGGGVEIEDVGTEGRHVEGGE